LHGLFLPKFQTEQNNMTKTEKELEYLPLSVKTAYNNLTDEQKIFFIEGYERRRRSPSTTQILAILSLHYIYLKRYGTFAIFVCTLGGCLIWWVYDIYRASDLADRANCEMSIEVLKEIKLLSL
jgi:hypothetical protein